MSLSVFSSPIAPGDQGRSIRTLETGELPAGRHTRTWDGVMASGAPAPAGLYLVRCAAAGRVLTTKALRLR